jgi:hypothetical protein
MYLGAAPTCLKLVPNRGKSMPSQRQKPAETRVARSSEDLHQQLRSHIRLLLAHCAAYDDGEPEMAKPISGILYQLCFHSSTKRGNKSLLRALKLVEGRQFLSSSPPPDQSSLAQACLTALGQTIYPDGGKWRKVVGHVPILCPEMGGLLAYKELPFNDWWTQTVIVMQKMDGTRGPTFSRVEIVCAVGDMDGGRHTDEGLEESYFRLTRENWLGIGTQVDADGSVAWAGGVAHATIRQIAHELLLTLRILVPEAFAGQAYEFPSMPLIPDMLRGGRALFSDNSPPFVSADAADRRPLIVRVPTLIPVFA